MAEFARELSQLPFKKFHPDSFRVRMASLTARQRKETPVLAWINTVNAKEIKHVIAVLAGVRVIRECPHINYLLVETTASELDSVDDIPAIKAVWPDEPVTAGFSNVVDRSRADPGPVAERHEGKGR